MRFFIHLTRRQSIADLVKILLLSLAGYLFLSGSWQNLYWIITPRPPLLVDINWQGSTMEHLYTKGYLKQTETYHYRVGLWRSYDGGNDLGHAELVIQSTIWYADPQDAERAWHDSRKTIIDESYNSRFRFFFPSTEDMNFILDNSYVMPLPQDLSIPSSLQCYNYDYTGYTEHIGRRRTCIYLGYYEHWVTQIWFAQDEGHLDDQAMFELVEKALEILKSAPPP